ncbi:site-specific integrase [Nocardioides psychrotolerans]|uniref:Site-specific recombinase XerD n=1 Tax=Nocardioides psychrotolerans TaxID=1005945 RepID=A0A1I3I7U0_9ACTN|nr:tyrosine-type recombinase/integrase [Nocardioides psychrotolerans]GEP40126.1 site-specific integrase [Nocardioides psychrotolerans]SFI44064.1 Site-specific recombinase XerD [Nocardioides psychrotolerans]
MSTTGRRGSVKQSANGSWFFIIDVPSRDLDANGKVKRKQTRRRGFKTRREAQAELTRTLGTLGTLTYVAPQNQTLAEFLTTTWLPAIEHTIKPLTFQAYRRMLRRHIIERAIGGMKLQQVDGPALNIHYALLLAGDGTYEALGATTVRNIATILHRAFRDAMRWQAVSRNPVEASDPPRPSVSPEMNTWTAGQLHTFLEVARDHRHAAAWWILGTTGMRRGEALGLRWSDIDLEKQQVKVQRALLTGEGGKMWSSPKTKAGKRVVSIDTETVALLRSHKARQNEEKLALGAGYVDDDLVTAQEDGQSVSPTRITEQFGRIFRRAGLPHIRLHDLRHTYATLALEAGINPKVVQEALGHSHVSVTLGIYSHVDQKMQASAAALLAAMRKAASEVAT